MAETQNRWKTLLKSRTVWVCLATAVGFILKEVYAVEVDQDTLIGVACSIGGVFIWLLYRDKLESNERIVQNQKS